MEPTEISVNSKDDLVSQATFDKTIDETQNAMRDECLPKYEDSSDSNENVLSEASVTDTDLSSSEKSGENKESNDRNQHLSEQSSEIEGVQSSPSEEVDGITQTTSVVSDTTHTMASSTSSADVFDSSSDQSQSVPLCETQPSKPTAKNDPIALVTDIPDLKSETQTTVAAEVGSLQPTPWSTREQMKDLGLVPDLEMDEDTAVMEMAGTNAQRHRENRNSKRFSSSSYDGYPNIHIRIDSSEQEIIQDDKATEVSGTDLEVPSSPMIDSGIAVFSDTAMTTPEDEKQNSDWKEVTNGQQCESSEGKRRLEVGDRRSGSSNSEQIVAITEGTLKSHVVPPMEMITAQKDVFLEDFTSSVDPPSKGWAETFHFEHRPYSLDSYGSCSPLFQPIPFKPVAFSELTQFSEEMPHLKDMASHIHVSNLPEFNRHSSSSVDPDGDQPMSPSGATVTITHEDTDDSKHDFRTISDSSLLESDFTSGLESESSSSLSKHDEIIPFENLDRLTQMAAGARPKERCITLSSDPSDLHAPLTGVNTSSSKSQDLSSVGEILLSPSIEDPFDDSFRLDTTGDDTDVFLDDTEDFDVDDSGECH